MPIKAMVPAALTLMLYALDFVNRTGTAQVGTPELVRATHIFANEMFKAFHISNPMLASYAARVHAVNSGPRGDGGGQPQGRHRAPPGRLAAHHHARTGRSVGGNPMVSLMNGLSSMGSGIASFAGTAGLEQQKATFAQQGMVLADQLAHTSKTAEITQAGTIAAGAAEKLQESTLAQLAVTTASAQKVATIGAGATIAAAGEQAGATLGAARISAATSTANTAALIAAQAPLVAQQVAAATANVGMAQDQQALAHTSFEISTQIAAETAKPPEQQDTAKISQPVQSAHATRHDARRAGEIPYGARRADQGDAAAAYRCRCRGRQDDRANRHARHRRQGAPGAGSRAKGGAAAARWRNAQLTLLLRSAQTYLPHAPGAPSQGAAPGGAGKPFDPSQFGKTPTNTAGTTTPPPGAAATPMPGTGIGLNNAQPQP